VRAASFVSPHQCPISDIEGLDTFTRQVILLHHLLSEHFLAASCFITSNLILVASKNSILAANTWSQHVTSITTSTLTAKTAVKMSLSNSFNVLCIDEDGMHSDTCSESPHEPLAISDSNHFEIARLEAYNADNDGLDGWEIVAPKSTRWNDGFAKTSQVDDWFVHPDAQSPTDEATSWNAIDSLVNSALPNSSDTPSALDTIPYPLCEDGDLVEIDIEAHYANGKVCEVGISHVRTSALPTATAKYLSKAETDDCFSAAWDAITSTTFAISR
jgi:hypothetical protein